MRLNVTTVGNLVHAVQEGKCNSSIASKIFCCSRGNTAHHRRTHLEVESDKGEHEALEILDEVVKDAQPLRVVALLHVQQGPDLRALMTVSDKAAQRGR